MHSSVGVVGGGAPRRPPPPHTSPVCDARGGAGVRRGRRAGLLGARARALGGRPRVHGERAGIDGEEIFDLRDEDRPLLGGAVALVCEEGRAQSEVVRVRPLGGDRWRGLA